MDPKQGYNHAKFERLALIVLQEKLNVKLFFK